MTPASSGSVPSATQSASVTSSLMRSRSPGLVEPQEHAGVEVERFFDQLEVIEERLVDGLDRALRQFFLFLGARAGARVGGRATTR